MKHRLLGLTYGEAVLVLVATLFVSWAWGLFSPAARAQTADFSPLDAFAFETLSITSVATGFTASTIAPSAGQSARAAVCTVETNPARYEVDGGTPSATVGLLWPVTTVGPYQIVGMNNVRRFKAIATTGTTKLSCTYYR